MTAAATQVKTCTVKYRCGTSDVLTATIELLDGYPNELDLTQFPFRKKPERWHLELIVSGWKVFRERLLAQVWRVLAQESQPIILHVAAQCGIADAARDYHNGVKNLVGDHLVDRYIERYVVQHPDPEKVGPYLAWRGVETIYVEFRNGDPRVAAYMSSYLAKVAELNS